MATLPTLLFHHPFNNKRETGIGLKKKRERGKKKKRREEKAKKQSIHNLGTAQLVDFHNNTWFHTPTLLSNCELRMQTLQAMSEAWIRETK
jgi:hypothetical protein